MLHLHWTTYRVQIRRESEIRRRIEAFKMKRFEASKFPSGTLAEMMPTADLLQTFDHCLENISVPYLHPPFVAVAI